MLRRRFLATLPAAALAAPGERPDWPQWRGPNRDGVSMETGLAASWPASGPPVLWQAKGLGTGYGSIAIARDKIFVQGTRGSDSVVWALNRDDGKNLWTAKVGRARDQDRGGGPRGTPTVENDRLYALGEDGDLICASVKDGSIKGGKNILRDFRGENPNWLISESPLIDGEKLIVTPGGSGAGMVAIHKISSTTIWTAKDLSDTAGYASAIARDVNGVRVLMNLTSEAGVGVRAADGKLLWRYEKAANGTANCTTPVFDNNKVFYTSAYGTGGGLLQLKAGDGRVDANEVYFTRELMNHHGGVVLYNGYLYGFSNAILTCLEFATGKVMWKDRSVGKGSLVVAGGHLYLLGENQTAGLAVATPAGYQEKGRFKIEDQGLPSWAHPVVCDGRLYIRNQGLLTCYNARA